MNEEIRELVIATLCVLAMPGLVRAQSKEAFPTITLGEYVQMTAIQKGAAIDECVKFKRRYIRETPESAKGKADEREVLNFLTAWFETDPEQPKIVPPGYEIIDRAVGQEVHTSLSSLKAFDVSSEKLCEVAYDAMTPAFADATKPWLAQKDTEYQVAYYRLEAEVARVKRATDAALKEAVHEKQRLAKKQAEIYDYGSIVLPNGIHVLPSDKSDQFFVLTRDGKNMSKNPIIGEHKVQAQKLLNCIRSFGRAKCGQPVPP